MPALRRLPDLTADGPTQMAADEALLESATGPTVRLYRWSSATVSLGYFQHYSNVVERLRNTTGLVPPMVRRITGGGAIWHEHEITYCLVGRLGHDGLPTRPAAVYVALHQAIAEALARRGSHTERQTITAGDRRYAVEPRCFASPAVDDLLTQGAKALGSAARTRGERLLVHGSLKLASNPWDGALAAGCGLGEIDAAAALLEGLAAAVDMTLTNDDWTAAELAARTRIHAQRYGSTNWVERREGPPA